jgi:DNA-binding IclR family transcriptional regulator
MKSVLSLSGNEAHTIPTVNKTLELVRVLAAGDDETTTKALALSLGLPRSTCYRILRSLIAQDWVRPLPGGRHELSLGLLPLLAPLRPTEVLVDAVGPALESLARRSLMTAKVSVHQGDYAVTVARCESPQETSVAVRVGASFHLALGSSGGVLLSALEEEEREEILERAPEACWAYQNRTAIGQRLRDLTANGWCCDLGTFRPSCHALSVPICAPQDRVVAALTLIGFPHEFAKERLPELAHAALEAARQAERALRHAEPARTTGQQPHQPTHPPASPACAAKLARRKVSRPRPRPPKKPRA